MKTLFAQPSIDVAGFWISIFCALHCVAIPLLLSFATIGSLAFLEEPPIEYMVLGISITIGAGSLLPSYFRRHRKFAALAIILPGFILIALSRRIEHGVMESVLTGIGACMVAVSHLVNLRLCKKYHRRK